MKNKTVIAAFARMNPITSGHEALVRSVTKLADSNNADHVIYLSKTKDKKKNPLSVDQKIFFARQTFRGVNFKPASAEIRHIIDMAKDLSNSYQHLIIVAGSDRQLEFKQLLDKYNGKEYNFSSILVVSSGDRDPDSDSTTGVSATKLRQAAAENNFTRFKTGVPSSMPLNIAKNMFDKVREGMGETDSVRESYIKKEIFNIGDIVIHENEEKIVVLRGANYVTLNTGETVWLSEIRTTDKVDESTMNNHQDKLKAARIIGMSLGYADAESKTDPVQIVNTALTISRNKILTPESKKIVARMLNLAREIGINFDENLSEDQASADFKVSKDGRKYHKVLRTNNSKDTDMQESANVIIPPDANTSPEEKEKHNLMHKPSSFRTEYDRLRKIQLKVHEEKEDNEDLDFDDDDITDEDIIEHGYEDEDFNLVDSETGEIVESMEADTLDAVNEVLSRVERMRAKVRMKRSEAKRERALSIALKRRSSGAVLAHRARRVAVKTIEKKLARKPLEQLSVAEKERIEARVQRMGSAITRLAAKMLPRVRSIEKTRLEHKTTEK